MRRGMPRGVFVVAALLMFLAIVAPLQAATVNVSPAEAQQLLARSDSAYLLDVRSLGEFMQVRIAGAHLIPIDQFLARQGEVPRERPVLVYCAVGSRSAQVADYLSRQGYSRVYNMTGGIMGWQLRGYPVLKGEP